MTRLDYCQFLLVSQINYTLTYFGDHHDTFSHDAINRYLLFDDTVLDKDFSRQIELVRYQYSGNVHGLIRGIDVVTCVYVNPELDQFWLIDYRLYDPDGDGKSKLDHVHDILSNVVTHKHLPFYAVLMDTWYATKDLMFYIESLN